MPPIADAVRTHAEVVMTAMSAWSTGSVLPNYAAGTGMERLAQSYEPETPARLSALADRYDPKAVFRAGQVPPRAIRK